MSIFADAYGACTEGNFAPAVEILSTVNDADIELHDFAFERKALPGMLLLSPEGNDGNTMLHWAAHHGDELGAKELLRLGAAPQQRNARGHNSLDVALAFDRSEGLCDLLRSHASAWAGWGITEMSCLACLYHDDRFVDSEAYLKRMIERDKARCKDVRHSLFYRPLPSGLRMVDIARRMTTAGTELLQEEYEELFADDEDDHQEGAAAGEGREGGAAEDTEEEGTEEDDDVEWPDDGWSWPAGAGYMVCALCKGASGVQGRWGAGEALHPSNLRYPLAVCKPCQRRHLGQPEPPAGGEDEEAEVENGAYWVEGALLLLARSGYWDSRIVQLAHPVFGDIGH